MKKLIAFLLLLPRAFVLHAAEPIEVSLTTNSALLPIYLVPWSSTINSSNSSYIEALEQVWRYDFAHNGITQQLADTAARRKLSDSSFESMGSQSAWQSLQTRYVVKVKIENNQIAARIMDVANNAIKETQILPLTGDINTDRRQVHHLADAIVKAISGKEGIASTSLLYTLRQRIGLSDKWQSDIWECDYDGANAHAVVQGQGYCVCPAYLSPSSGKAAGGFCYVSYLSGQPKIYIAARKNPVGRRLTELRGNQLMPTMTRQRDSIAFISDVAGNPDLFLLAFDPERGAKGKPRQIFSARPATQASPSFSPDGKQLAFVSDKDGSARVYTLTIPDEGVSLQQIKAKLITKLNRESSAPAWSPDGKYISYCSMTEGVRQIWSYDLEENKERQLTFGPGHKENPSWAPDSLHLVYNLSNNDQSELYFLDIVQLQPQQLFLGRGEKRFPSWEPR